MIQEESQAAVMGLLPVTLHQWSKSDTFHTHDFSVRLLNLQMNPYFCYSFRIPSLVCYFMYPQRFSPLAAKELQKISHSLGMRAAVKSSHMHIYLQSHLHRNFELSNLCTSLKLKKKGQIQYGNYWTNVLSCSNFIPGVIIRVYPILSSLDVDHETLQKFHLSGHFGFLL